MSAAFAIDTLRAGVPWAPSIVLDGTVVPELLQRAKEAGGHLMDYYVIALARARDPRTVEFLESVLSTDRNRAQSATSRFHAALGLANLRNARGGEWLIEHVDVIRSAVEHARPLGVCTTSLADSCVQAH